MSGTNGPLATVAIDSLVARASREAALVQWQGFVPFRPAESGQAPSGAVLINAGGKDGWYQHCHTETGPVRELGCYFLRDVTVSGHLYGFAGDRFLLDGSAPSDVALKFAAEEGLDPTRLIHRQRTIAVDRPLLVVAGPGYPIWGHWLLDFLPRLAIARETLGSAFGEFRIPLPQDTPGWVSRMMAFFCGVGEAQLLRYDRRQESIAAGRVCLPSYAHSNYVLHSFVRDFYQRFVGKAQTLSPERFCVSRRDFNGRSRSVARSFAEQAYFEAAAERSGFTPVRPEELDFRAQIDLFANARAIVGEYGSGMHSALFSPPGTVVGQFGMPNAIQSRIAGLCGHRMVYLYADSERIDSQGINHIDVRREAIDGLFRAMRAMG